MHADCPRDQPTAEQQQRDSGGDLEASQDGPLAALPRSTGIRRRAEPFDLIKRRSQGLPDGDRLFANAGELMTICGVPSTQATGPDTALVCRKEVLDDPRTRA
jgi:hypothetical protein